MEEEFYGQVLNEEDMAEELAKLDELAALQELESMPSAGKGALPSIQQEEA